MIARLIVAILVAMGTAALIRPYGQRHRWSPPVAFGLSMLGGFTAALIVNALVFG